MTTPNCSAGSTATINFNTFHDLPQRTALEAARSASPRLSELRPEEQRGNAGF